MMFSRQFGAVRPLAANAPSPVYLYAVETALQLAMTELSENPVSYTHLKLEVQNLRYIAKK